MNLSLGNDDKSRPSREVLRKICEGEQLMGKQTVLSDILVFNLSTERVLLVKTPRHITVLDFEVISCWISNALACEAGIRKKKFCSSSP